MRRWCVVLFDWDGTLADTHELYWDTALTVGARYGLTFSNDIRTNPHFQSVTPFEFFAHHFTTAGASEIEATRLATRAVDDMFHLFLSEQIARVTLFPYVSEILADARGHVGMVGLVTSSPRAIINATLQHLALEKHFDLIVTADDVTRQKPHPEPYQIAMQRLRARHAIVIENTPIGVTSGNAAMATVVGIASSHTTQELQHAGAHYTAENHEMLKWLLMTLYIVGQSSLDTKGG